MVNLMDAVELVHSPIQFQCPIYVDVPPSAHVDIPILVTIDCVRKRKKNHIRYVRVYKDIEEEEDK